MASLLTESFCNNVKTKTEGILQDHSNIKEFIQIIIDKRIDNLNSVYNLKANYNFKEIGTDLVTKLLNTISARDLLESYGYKQTTMEDYNYENYNALFNISEVDYIKKENNCFLETIKLFSKDIEKDYMYHFKDNYVIFTPTISNSPTEYYFDFKDYKVIDFKIDKNYFVYMILEKEEIKYFVKTHLGKEFIRYNEDLSKLDISSCFSYIVINNLITSLEYYENNEFYFFTKDLKVLKILFGKKYYFEDGEYLYFNNQGDLNNYKQHFIEEKQINFLNMYNVLNFLGLNEFDINSRKISTKENILFLDLFKNKYDNTLNGGLNYFNSLPNSIVDGKPIKNAYSKDYHISISDEYFSINGNFQYDNFSKGSYKIEVQHNKVLLFKKIRKRYVMVESVKFPTFKEFYFCNLFFQFKKYEFPNHPYVFEFTAKDSYVFKQSEDEIVKFEKIPNNKLLINNIFKESSYKYKTVKLPFFDGKSIVFNNYFDWNKKEYLFGNLYLEVNNHSIVDVGDNSYYCNTQYDFKNGKLYIRGKGNVVYTLSDKFKFDLINDKGYITNFWIENQNKTVFFKCSNNKITISNNDEESDFYCYIPPIQNYIDYDENEFSNIEVVINDSLEINRPYNDNILITDKFYDIPLFYKVYIPETNLDFIKIFDSDDKEIVKYITKEFKNGYIFYFNVENSKKYYYNTENTKYNYFTPIESYQNIEFDYFFDEACYINLATPTSFGSITLKSLKNISEEFSLELFIYNELDEITNKITFNSMNLNTKFELDLSANKFYLKVNSNNYQAKDFYITEDSNKSIINNYNIVFFKESRDSIVYTSKKNKKIDFKSIDYSTIKVNTYYDLSNDDMLVKSTNKGILKIFSLNPGEIGLLHCNNLNKYIESPIFKIASLGKDNNSFYINNFKEPGSYYQYNNISPKNIATYSSSTFELSKKDGGVNEQRN